MKNNASRYGVLLLNLGTPDDCQVSSVRRYLREFLNDPRVVDLPAWIRWPLVNGFIIPLRVKKSTKAYQAIWTKEGSPLLQNSLRLKSALAEKLSESCQVALAMRYGRPTIESALDSLKGCRRIMVIPLFPQYASAVTGSLLAKVFSVISDWSVMPDLVIKSSFYQDPEFIDPYAKIIMREVAGKKIDVFLFSYHGLPERQVDRKNCFQHCKNPLPCPVESLKKPTCYRAQCYATSRSLAAACGLSDSSYVTAFQSRLGGTPWIKPYADQCLLSDLVKQGARNVAVICPSFVADCLETLEEIGIRMKEDWRKLGGGKLILVPSLNDDPAWVDSLAGWVRGSLDM